MKRFVLHPGTVISESDGQLHWISAEQLIHLYNVRPEDCIIEHCLGMIRQDNLEHLYPRARGDYWDADADFLYFGRLQNEKADWRQDGF